MKIIKRIIAVVLSFIFGIICGIVTAETNYFGIMDTQEEKKETFAPAVSPSWGSGMTITANADEATMLSSSNVIRLTATVTADSSALKKVDWSVSFANPTSAWASGKTATDYVSVTPTADGALTADVDCLQAFDSVIIVTATARYDSSISATCEINYLKRWEMIEFHMSDGLDAIAEPYISLIYPTFYNIGPKSIGTIQGEIDIGFTDSAGMYYPFRFTLYDSFMEAVESHPDYINACQNDGGTIQFIDSGDLNSWRDGEISADITTFFSHIDSAPSSVTDYLCSALEEISTTFQLENKPIGYIEIAGIYSYSTFYEVEIDERFDFYAFTC